MVGAVTREVAFDCARCRVAVACVFATYQLCFQFEKSLLLVMFAFRYTTLNIQPLWYSIATVHATMSL